MSTRRFVVVGNPIAHSLSPQIHQAFAAQRQVSLSYDKVCVDLQGFAAFAEQFQAQGGVGMNVTVPFKTDAHQWVDWTDPVAGAAGAVNTIVFAADAAKGHNTDGVGLIRDLCQRHGETLAGRRVLLLGAGGAARGVLPAVLAEQPAELIIANRTLNKAQALRDAQQWAQSVVLSATDLNVHGRFDVVINATAFGLDNEALPLDAAVVKDAFCYDMVYGAKARFRTWAQACGARRSVDGLGMLVEQAAESFWLWHDRDERLRPDTDPVLAQLRSAI